MRRLPLFLLLSTMAVAQSVVFYTDRALATSPFSSNGVQVPAATFVQYGQVRVCSIPTSGIPCNTPASITDIFGNPLSIVGGNFGQITTDVVGRFSFGCTPGLYQIQVAASSSNTPLLNYPITCPSGTSALLTSANNWTGTNTFNGTTNLLGGGTQTGTWAGTPTYTGATIFSGGLTSTGGFTATSGQNSLTAFSLNNIIFVDGIKYTTIASAVTACPANGCEIWTPNNYRETLTSQLILGTAAVGNTKPIGLRLGRDTILTVNVTGGVCGVVIPTGSSIAGPEAHIGVNSPNNGGATLQLASTANVSAEVCNGDTTGAQEYFSMMGVAILDNASATVTGALVDLQALFVPSMMRDMIIAPSGHVGLRYRDVSGAGFGPFACDNCWINGLNTAGSQPLVIQSVASGGLMSGINFYGGAIEHAGTGQLQVSVDGTAGPSGAITGPNFFGTYCENSFAASSCFKFKDTTDWNLVGVVVDGVAGTDVVNIARSAATRAGIGTIVDLKDNNGFTNIINDTTRSTTITSASVNGSMAHYVFYPGDVVVGSGLGLASGTATMTTAAIGSLACGTTVTVAATGVTATDAISWAFNAAPAANPGELVVSAWPTTNNVNFQYCNPTAGSVTPAAATLNWRVIR